MFNWQNIKLILMFLLISTVAIYIVLLRYENRTLTAENIFKDTAITNYSQSLNKAAETLASAKRLITENNKLCNDRLEKHKQINQIIDKKPARIINEYQNSITVKSDVIDIKTSSDVIAYLNSLFVM